MISVGMWNVCVIRGVHREFWWENLRQTDHLKNLGVDGCIILKWIFKKNYEDLGLD
jgi:hypothetical protein